MKRLYFIRHGESEMNVSGLFAGSATETPLTAKGKHQAVEAGKKARELNIDLIISSPQSRAFDTARIVANEIDYPEDNIITNDLLVERFYGQMEGKPYSKDISIQDFSDAEKKINLLNRARKALDFIESHPEDNILVVSHGSFGRALRHHAKEDFPFSRYHRIPNAQIIELI